MQIPSMPFKVLALGPFRLQEEELWRHEPIRVEKTNLDEVMGGLELSLEIPLPKNLSPSGGLTIPLKRLKDFHPDRLIENNPFLKNILDTRRFIEEGKTKGLSEEEVYRHLKEWPDLPIEIKLEPRKPEKISSTSPMDEILKMVSIREEGSLASHEAQSLIAQIDSILQKILKRIFLDQNFRHLESTWRGLQFFAKQGGSGGEIKMDIVPVSFQTLEETVSHLMVALVEDLPSIVILDLPFDNSPRSLELLEKIAELSETLLVPTLCWITPKFFYLDTWQELRKLSFLPHYLEEPNFAKWRHLKETPPARWLAITCNRFLGRYPYGPDNQSGLIRFEESEDLWISPVWAVGVLLSGVF